jgi:hypothetical protein
MLCTNYRHVWYMALQSLYSGMFRHDSAIFREYLPSLKTSTVNCITSLNFITFEYILLRIPVCVWIKCVNFLRCCSHNTFKYVRLTHDIYNILEISHILSTFKLVLASECTQRYEFQRRNAVYYIGGYKLVRYSQKMALSCWNRSQ